MHREILKTRSKLIDHINGDSLDNRRNNLRGCSARQNQRNQKVRQSGFKGITWVGRLNKWQAQIRFNKKLYHLGVFTTAQEAACAYDFMATELFGPFAKLNRGRI